MNIGHFGSTVHERRKALYVFLLLRYVPLIFQNLCVVGSKWRSRVHIGKSFTIHNKSHPVAAAGAAEVTQSASKVKMSRVWYAQQRSKAVLVAAVIAQQHVLGLYVAVTDGLRQQVQGLHAKHHVPASVRGEGDELKRSDKGHMQC